MENGVRKREWVKTAAIILLAVLLVLTFFSKTIMNASLPEVATQQVSSGAINARIRGQGTVEASEVYNVTIKQTRKVSSVLVKTGQEITSAIPSSCWKRRIRTNSSRPRLIWKRCSRITTRA